MELFLWLFVVLSVACAIVYEMAVQAWLLVPTRFSLRTLLIATTLVAVVLGTIVWLVT